LSRVANLPPLLGAASRAAGSSASEAQCPPSPLPHLGRDLTCLQCCAGLAKNNSSTMCKQQAAAAPSRVPPHSAAWHAELHLQPCAPVVQKGRVCRPEALLSLILCVPQTFPVAAGKARVASEATLTGVTELQHDLVGCLQRAVDVGVRRGAEFPRVSCRAAPTFTRYVSRSGVEARLAVMSAGHAALAYTPVPAEVFIYSPHHQ